MNRRQAIVEAARTWINTPYRHQASVKGAGCDCLGLVRGVWREVVGPEPEPMTPYSPEWAETTGADALLAVAHRYFTPVLEDQWREGDLLVFRFRPNFSAKHLAIAGTPQTIIHAHDGARVVETPLIPFWRRKIAGAFAFPGVDEASERESE